MKQQMDLVLTLTTEDGVMVPVEVRVEYPDGMGLYAVLAISKIAEEKTDQLYSRMVSIGDESTLMALSRIHTSEAGD